MNEETQVLLEEWKDIRESLRYFGNKRFAQLTVFIAANGFILDAFFEELGTRNNWFHPIIGIILGILFFLMERSSVKYWRKFVDRSKAIEANIVYIKLMTEYRPNETKFSATNATYLLYICITLFWFLALAYFYQDICF